MLITAIDYNMQAYTRGLCNTSTSHKLTRSISQRRPKNNIQRERKTQNQEENGLVSLKTVWSLTIWKLWFNYSRPTNQMAYIRVGKHNQSDK